MLPKIPSLTDKKSDAESLDNDKSELITSHAHTPSHRRKYLAAAVIAGSLIFVCGVFLAAFFLTQRGMDFQLVGLTQASGIAVNVEIGSDNSTAYSFSFELGMAIENDNYYQVTWDSILLNTSIPTPDIPGAPITGSATVPPSISFPARRTTYLTLPFTVVYNFTSADSTGARAYMELLYACGLYASELAHPLQLQWNMTVESKWLAHTGQNSWSGVFNTSCPIEKQILLKLPVPSNVAPPLSQSEDNPNIDNFVGK